MAFARPTVQGLADRTAAKQALQSDSSRLHRLELAVNDRHQTLSERVLVEA